MLRHIRFGMLFLSVCYVILGVLLLAAPGTSLPWLCLGVSAAVLLTGAVSLVRYFRNERRSFSAACLLVGGAVTTALGIFTLLRPGTVRLVLPIIFALFIMVDGVARLGAAFRFVRRLDRWWVLALLGLLSCLLGALLIAQDTIGLVSLIKDIIPVSGVLLVVEGTLNLGCTVYIGMARKQLADAAEAAAAAQAAAEAAQAAVEPPQPPVIEATAAEVPPAALPAAAPTEKGDPAP